MVTVCFRQENKSETSMCLKRILSDQWHKYVIRDIPRTRTADELVSDNLQLVKGLGAMGVERQHFADQSTGTSSRDNHVRRGEFLI
jgi:hypothetical protein